MRTDLLFYTAATGFYHNFIPLYCLFGGLKHPGAKFEFLVRNSKMIQDKHLKSLQEITNHLQINVVLNDISKSRIRPAMENSYRFLLEPQLKAKYVYIGDIDIILTRNVFEENKGFLENDMNYHNIIRENSSLPRLTGLHLAKYDHMYPLHHDLAKYYRQNDEHILYKNYQLKGKLHNKKEQQMSHDIGRPLCGVHMSLNRLPFSYWEERVHWGIEKQDLKVIDDVLQDKDIRKLVSNMYEGSKQILWNATCLYRGYQNIKDLKEIYK